MNNKKTTTQKAIKIMLYVVMIIIFTLMYHMPKQLPNKKKTSGREQSYFQMITRFFIIEGIKSLHSIDFDNAEKHFKKAIKNFS
jgi:hypothetical protein